MLKKAALVCFMKIFYDKVVWFSSFLWLCLTADELFFDNSDEVVFPWTAGT